METLSGYHWNLKEEITTDNCVTDTSVFEFISSSTNLHHMSYNDAYLSSVSQVIFASFVSLKRCKTSISILDSKNVEALINFGTFFRKSHCVNYIACKKTKQGNDFIYFF